MIAQKRRFPLLKEGQSFLARAFTWRSSFFTLRYLSGSGRLATIAAKKTIDPRSSHRHQIQRNFLHLLYSQIDFRQFPYDCVFFLQKPIVGANEETINQEIEKVKEYLNTKHS